MIIARAPYRISFFGGSTDYEEWYRNHGGVFLSSAINHSISIIIRRKPALDEHQYRVVWRELEDANTIEEIKHPFVRAALQHRKIDMGLDIVYFGELPHGSGLGSSSTFGVAFLTALNRLLNLPSTAYERACEVYEIERHILKETVGIQDQMAASHGGFNLGKISHNGQVTMQKIELVEDRMQALNERLLLIFTGLSRHASGIARSTIRNFANQQKTLHTMSELAYEAYDILTSGGDLDDFGRLLDKSWTLKRNLSNKVTTDVAETIYEKAKLAGAIGGKLLGAGGGGFMLLFVKEGKKEAVSKVLRRFGQVPFQLGAEGPKVILDSPQLYSDYYDRIWAAADA